MYYYEFDKECRSECDQSSFIRQVNSETLACVSQCSDAPNNYYVVVDEGGGNRRKKCVAGCEEG